MIEKVEPVDITEEDLEYLMRSLAVANEKSDQVLKELGIGTACLWRLSAKGMKGVMVTTVQGKSLYVWHLAGEGIWRYWRSLIAEVKIITVRNGLESIVAQAIPDVAKVLTRAGFGIPRLVVEWRSDG